MKCAYRYVISQVKSCTHISITNARILAGQSTDVMDTPVCVHVDLSVNMWQKREKEDIEKRTSSD